MSPYTLEEEVGNGTLPLKALTPKGAGLLKHHQHECAWMQLLIDTHLAINIGILPGTGGQGN